MDPVAKNNNNTWDVSGICDTVGVSDYAAGGADYDDDV